jgi:hypothetical protein
MAVLNPPAFLQAGTYPASSDRLHQISSRFNPTALSTSDVACRGGVLGGQSARQFASSMTNWDVAIGKGVCVVENTFTSQGGDYIALNTATQTLAVTASSPTTNRIDIIGVRIQDAFYSGAVNSGDLAVVQGTPAAGVPSDPALPSSFLPLWRVTVNAGTTTGILADLRKRTSTLGSVYQPFTAQIADAGTAVGEIQLLAATAPYPARLRVWDGSAWRGVSPFQFSMPSPTATAALAPLTSGHVTASVSVPDPGFTYRLQCNGALSWAMNGPDQPEQPLSGTVTLDNTNWNGGIIAYSTAYSIAIPAGATQATNVLPTESTGDQTGAHTIRLIARNHGVVNMSILVDSFKSTALNVEMIPA